MERKKTILHTADHNKKFFNSKEQEIYKHVRYLEEWGSSNWSTLTAG